MKWKNLLRMTLGPLLLAAVALCAFLLFRLRTAEQIQQRTYGTLNRFALQQAEALHASIEEQYGVLEAVAIYAAERQDDPIGADDGRLIARSLTSNTVLTRIAYVDQFGTAILDDGSATNIADRAYFQASMRGERGLERVATGKLAGTTRYLFSVPVMRGGMPSGVVFGSMDESAFSSIVDTGVYADGSYSFVCSSDGTLLAAGAGASAMRGIGSLTALLDAGKLDGRMTTAYVMNSLRLGSTLDFRLTLDQGEQYVSCVPLGFADWYVVNVVSRASVEGVYDFVTRYALIMLVLLLLFCTGVVVLSAIREHSTTRALTEERDLIKRSEESYALISELSNDVLFRCDLSLDEVHFNGAFLHSLGYAPPWRRIDQLREPASYIYPDDAAAYQSIFQRVRDGAPRGSAELRLMNANGIPVWQRIDFIVQRGADGAPMQVVGRLTNIDRTKRALQRLRQRADSDPLTGLVNRTALGEQARSYLDGADDGALHAFFMIDIDDFKRFNDAQGHQEGDRLLTAFSASLTTLFRNSDIVCRMGGDEFSVFLHDAGDREAVGAKAAEICLAARALSDDFTFPVTASVGAAIFPHDGTTFEALYANADAALYGAKAAGKDRFLLYGEDQ